MSVPPVPGVDSAELERLLGSRSLDAVRWGLERIEAILDELEHPERSFRSVHVAGTNGKGSVAATVASVLEAEGRRTGLYTSPQLFDVRDRVRVGGRRASLALLERCARRVRATADAVGATYFEAVTALAFLAFREAAVSWAAVEVGLGGRLDATNVVEPAVCAVTNVAADHAEYLGDTLAEIAGEKAGILKSGVPAVLGRMPDRLAQVFLRRAEEKRAAVRRLGRDAEVSAVEVTRVGTSFTYRSRRRPEGLRLRTPLVGRHQADNAGLAVMALEELSEPPEPDALREGLGDLRWRARFEVVEREDGHWIVDVAHNVAGMEALASALESVPVADPVVFVLAVLGDKAWREMLGPALARSRAAVFTLAPSAPPGRRWNPAEAAGELEEGGVEVERDFGRALERARELAAGGTVVVAGSCYTAGDALRWLGRGPEA